VLRTLYTTIKFRKVRRALEESGYTQMPGEPA